MLCKTQKSPSRKIRNSDLQKLGSLFKKSGQKKRGEEKERQLQNVILYKQTPNQL